MSSEIEEEEYYDKRSFLSAKCAHKYDEYLEEEMPYFHGRLVTFGWMCFAIKLIMVNHALFCLSIICALVVPSTCNTKVMLDMIVLIVTIMDEESQKYPIPVSYYHVFYGVGVVKFPTYEEKNLGKEIHPLKNGRQGDRSKKRKIDFANLEFS
ncbi:hypothetical protein R3W88_007901 [Solanum pinnatisectum]|uniref:Uncharacterized protein n=1 Tax=Solanum pinnatisectum TaxID=50273 RepID=A0AAV9M9T6_9SOLN|nr:hypothetical protein R3W88_007901 [Solanum pinnatisectum]